jgi:thiamine kinase-like enzyme
VRTSTEAGARPWGGRGPAVTFAADVDATSRAEIEAVLAGWDPGLFPGGELEISVLPGGANNRNFVARTPRAKYALRIANPQNERFAVDRDSAIQAQRDAAAGGLAPAVAACRLPAGHVLSTFVEGDTLLGAGQLREREVLANVGRSLRRLHALPSSIRAFSPFDDVRLFAGLARSDGTPIPDDLDRLLGLAWEIEALLRAAQLPAVFCHNDTVPQNFIRSGEQLTLVDWDYAGRGWACFELASFCATADLDPELQRVLLHAYDEETSEAQLATVELLRFVATMREATWALMAAPILAGTTTPDSDNFYEDYMRDYLRLARQRAAAPDLHSSMKVAATATGARSW